MQVGGKTTESSRSPQDTFPATASASASSALTPMEDGTSPQTSTPSSSSRSPATRSPHKQSNNQHHTHSPYHQPSSASTPSSQSTHPLAQPPVTATAPSATQFPASQLPRLPQVNSLRSALSRRRSSFPPAVPPTASIANQNTYPAMPVTPGFSGFDFTSTFDGFPAVGESNGAEWTPENGWDALLNFDTEYKPSPSRVDYAPNQTQQPTSRAQSDPLSDHPPNQPSFMLPYLQGPTMQHSPAWPTRVAQMGDWAWKTALSSLVEVEGVGSVVVARILQEVWRRGGGDAVTAQCLWPSVIISLSMPGDSVPGVRIPTPSAQSAMALQQLYNLTIRHWEPSIFSGLLGAYISSTNTPTNAPPPPPQPQSVDAFPHHFGPSTPHREADPSQWINLTPSGWSNLLPQAMGKGNNGASFEASAFDLRRMSLAKTEVGDEQQLRGIDEILATMEETKEEMERAQIAANLADQARDIKQDASSQSSRSNSAFQLPTPETDGIDSPPNNNNRSAKIAPSGFSPVSMVSPFVSAGSFTTSLQAILPAPPSVTPVKAPSLKSRPTLLNNMPDNAFIPPPPMCMFFNPSFQDLQKGKMGVWQGDLEVRGRGGGKFPVMIVGEENTGHLWQANLWPESLAYPLAPTSVESCTSSMIPVSHLAREGLVPITMGMVLCKHTGPEITDFVNMVQGLHAEGVGFHLPCQTRLPIVFLPAKFNSEDPLQRLGIAFMGKASTVPALMPPANDSAAKASGGGNASRGRPVTAGRAGGSSGDKDKGEPKKKKQRRQSAPAGTAPLISATGVSIGSGGNRGQKRKESAMAAGRIEEEAEA